jgi:hypothetical protein
MAHCNRFHRCKNLKTRRDEISWHRGLKWALLLLLLLLLLPGDKLIQSVMDGKMSAL